MTFLETVPAHETLKPCPFCGGKPVINTRHWFGLDMYEVACVECTASQGDMTDLEYAMEQWNKRAERTCGTCAHFSKAADVTYCALHRHKANPTDWCAWWNNRQKPTSSSAIM